MTRHEALRKAYETVCKDRNNKYGEPEDNFNTISDLWSVYLHSKGYLSEYEFLDSADVALMMILMKVARHTNAPNPDDWVDIAGYAGCGAEVDGEYIEDDEDD